MHLGRRIREGIAVDLPDEVNPDEQIPTLPEQQPLEVEKPEPVVEPEKTPEVTPEPEPVPEPEVEPQPIEEPTPEEPAEEPQVEPAVEPEPEHDDDPLFPDYVPEQWPDNPVKELPVPEPEKVN